MIIPYPRDNTIIVEVDKELMLRDSILAELKQNLLKAKGRMKEQADKGRCEVEFRVGDMVYLKAQPYKLRPLTTRMNEKLSPRFYGPFKVLAKIGEVAYKLQLPESSRIHPVFHVSQLKKALPSCELSQELPKFLSNEFELMVEPEQVLGTRKLLNGKWQVLINGLSYPQKTVPGKIMR